jgi:hypothetical protein
MCAARAHGFLPSKVFVLFRSEDRIQTFSTKRGPVLVSVGVLANDKAQNPIERCRMTLATPECDRDQGMGGR